MGKGFYISKNLGLVCLIVGIGSVATIMALSVVYDKEKAKNRGPYGDDALLLDDVALLHNDVPEPTTSKEPWERYRLPDSLAPVTYDVTLWPRLVENVDGMYIFTGSSVVAFKCVKETDLILIHSNKLNLTLSEGHHAILTGMDGAKVPCIKTTWLQNKTNYLVIELNGKLTVGKVYRLHTEFQGELADDLEGIYRSEYIEDGVKKVVAVTQMQTTYARQAFPCFDEPAMKAVFNITLIHDRGDVALSNSMAIETVNLTIDDTPVAMTTFEPTKRMSTYLLAFIISDFASVSGSLEGSDVLVRIWGRRKAIEAGQADYALNVTLPILKFFESYYKAEYPLSKSDQIALPDFGAGAMENWGLITYRERNLLFDPASSSSQNKEGIATIISHELAHMWFGNLVTLRWWNDLWLNEGFASYVEYLGADYAEPTMDIKDTIVLYDLQSVFAVDALASSHPLSRPEEELNTPSEINEMFNSISYNKGAAVLRMLSEFLSEPVFAKGLSTYLNQFAFSNADYTDLWDHLQQAVNQTPGMSLPHSVHDIMNRWILQMGYPVVTIDTVTGNISQQHFLLDPESVVTFNFVLSYTWIVPMKWMVSGEVREQHWLSQKTATYLPMRTSGDDWVLVNLNLTGYYRVNYDLANWERLITQLRTDHKVIPMINRAQIIDDAFSLARAKIIDSALALRTTEYLSQETDYIPWRSAIRYYRYYILMFERTEAYGALQVYLRKQIKPLFEHYRTVTGNWTKVPARIHDQYNQINAMSLACKMGDKGCKEVVKGWFKQWMQNPDHNPIHPNLRTTVYCRAIAEGDAEEWDFAWAVFKNTNLASEASSLKFALSCAKKPWLLNRYLKYSLNPDKIRKQDALSIIQYVASNVVGLPLAWNFLRDKSDIIFKRYGEGSFSFSRLIKSIATTFSTEFELQQLKKFKEDNAAVGFGSGTLALEQGIEEATTNIKWVAENKPKVLLLGDTSEM